MTTLDVSKLRQLGVRSYNQLRVNLALPPGLEGRAAIAGEYRPERFNGTVSERGKVGDLVGTEWPRLYLVSERFLNVLRAGALTGWASVPIDIAGIELQEQLYVLQTTGRCGPLIYRGALKEECFLDPANTGWDGSDLFLPANNAGTYLTAAAAEILRKARLVNVALRPDKIKPLAAAEQAQEVPVSSNPLPQGITVDTVRAAENPGQLIFRHLLTLEGVDDGTAVIDALPAPLRWVWAIFLLDAEVSNGGFSQYFYNSSWQWIDDAMAGYEAMGLTEHARVVNAAAETALQPREGEIRRRAREARTLEAFSQTYEETALGEHDQPYFDLPEWEPVVDDYIRGHADEFVYPPRG